VNAPDVKPPLEYDRTGNSPTRRQFRLLLILTAVNTLFLGWFIAGPQTGQIFKAQWEKWQAYRAEKQKARAVVAAQQRCLDHTFPADLVIYEEDPDAAKKLLTEHAQYSAVAETNRPPLRNWPPAALLAKDPPPMRDLSKALGETGGYSLAAGKLFVGQRLTPGGKPMYVVISITPLASVSDYGGKETTARSTPRRILGATMMRPTTSSKPPEYVRQTTLEVQAPPTTAVLDEKTATWKFRSLMPMRFLAGQADPADPTHVVVPYSLCGQPGAIDVYLTEEGLLFKPRTGEITLPEGRQTVTLPAPPTTKPS
jgi:hypothetical protein